MSHKSISTFPPDRWIRQVNRRYPNLWADLKKNYADPSIILRSGSNGIYDLKSVPDWCIMPTLFPFILMTDRYGMDFYLTHMDELMTLASTYIWRCSKGVYRFAPEIYDILTAQPLSGELPVACLYHLPEWAVYIETPGLTYENRRMTGFIAHLDYNLFSRDVDLQFAMFFPDSDMPKMLALPLGDGTLSDAMDRVDQVDSMFMGKARNGRYIGGKTAYHKTFSAMIQLLLYLCSDEPDMPAIEHPQNRKRFCGTVRPPLEPRIWDVGVRVSSVIRNYRNEDKKYDAQSDSGVTHSSPRPHIRSAHWQTYWVGPRTASFPERRPVLHWIPPIPVMMDWKRELPTNVRKIGK